MDESIRINSSDSEMYDREISLWSDHLTPCDICFNDIALYLTPEMTLPYSRNERMASHIFDVQEGTLFLLIGENQEIIPIRGGLWVGSLNTDILIFGSPDCCCRYAHDNRNREILKGSLSTMDDINEALYQKDRYTSDHCRRVRRIVFSMALSLKLTPARIYTLRLGALYHDIGKIDVPEAILLKEGRLTKEEFACIMKHPARGEQILNESGIINMEQVSRIIGDHHEHMDGSGYPRGVTSEDISLETRILSIADSYDALTTDRPYREAMTAEQALELMRSYPGWLDLTLVDLLEEVLNPASDPQSSPA